MKAILLLALLTLAAQAAHAQEVGGAVDLGQLSRTQTNAAMMRAQAARDRKAQLQGKRPASRPLTPAQQRLAHRREVEAAMRQPAAAPGSIR